MRIIVIGPIAPYRGGIAHYSTIVCRNLSREHEVIAVSFSRLYPRLFFNKPLKDPQLLAPTEFKTHELIDSLNPFSWWRTINFIRKQKPDRIIFQWWTTFLAPCYAFMIFFLKRNSTTDAKIGIMMHNVYPHPTESSA